jgi:hypothetical protein
LSEKLEQRFKSTSFLTDLLKLIARQFASNFARSTLSKCVSRKARRDAACTIQRYDYCVCYFPYCSHRAWRGFVGRSISSYFTLLARMLREKKPKPPPSRFKAETFRRIWARKDFEPTGGWPGKADFIEFDMWDHAYVPPKGNKYGLKTHKVSDKDKRVLTLHRFIYRLQLLRIPLRIKPVCSVIRTHGWAFPSLF